MPVQTLTKLPAERFNEAHLVLVRNAHPRAAAIERSVYQSRRLSPGSAIAALMLAAAAFSSFQYLDTVSPYHKPERRLTVVELLDLAKPPPPPEPERPPLKQADDLPHVQPPIVAPPPIVATPAPAPVMAVAEVPAPPASAPVAASVSSAKAVDAGPAAPSAAASEAGDLSSKMISAQPPTYPVESRRLREQGTVVLSVLLSTDGRVERLSIARSSGFPRLDRAASGAVRHWRWSPTVRDGQPVLVQGNVVIPFVLRG